MKLSEIFNKEKATLSFEVFPPKTTTAFDSVKRATEQIAELKPSFMSVTYGAGGSNDKFTVDIAQNILKKYRVPTIAHLTCVGSSNQNIDAKLDLLKDRNIMNILALRGDLPETCSDGSEWAFNHANELISYIKSHGDFCVGAACYPEAHPESENQKQDILNLKLKSEAGCDFFTTQMFFDNNILYNFLYKIREAGIFTRVVAGIMPVTNGNQIKRICALSNTVFPTRFRQIVDKFGDNPQAMAQAGVAYATEQIVDLLANGIKNIHVYSMNKPDIAQEIKKNLEELLKV